MSSKVVDGAGRRVATGPQGFAVRGGKDGVQVIRSKGERWTDEAEAMFLDHLAASCNVTASAEAAGFTNYSAYKRRRTDPAFAQAWQAALEQGYARIEMALVRRAGEALDGLPPDPDTPIPVMTVSEAISILGRHRNSVEGGPRSRRQWARPRSLDEMRDSILAKLEAIAPVPALPAPSFETASQSATSTPPQDERSHEIPARPEEGGRMADRLEG